MVGRGRPRRAAVTERACRRTASGAARAARPRAPAGSSTGSARARARRAGRRRAPRPPRGACPPPPRSAGGRCRCDGICARWGVSNSLFTTITGVGVSVRIAVRTPMGISPSSGRGARPSHTDRRKPSNTRAEGWNAFRYATRRIADCEPPAATTRSTASPASGSTQRSRSADERPPGLGEDVERRRVAGMMERSVALGVVFDQWPPAPAREPIQARGKPVDPDLLRADADPRVPLVDLAVRRRALLEPGRHVQPRRHHGPVEPRGIVEVARRAGACGTARGRTPRPSTDRRPGRVGHPPAGGRRPSPRGGTPRRRSRTDRGRLVGAPHGGCAPVIGPTIAAFAGGLGHQGMVAPPLGRITMPVTNFAAGDAR